MNDSQLNDLLKSCGSCPTPQGFASDVWNRIAAEPDSTGVLAFWSRMFTQILDRLSQPIGALATCATFILAGTLIGLSSRPESQSPEVQYIQSVSPFAHR